MIEKLINYKISQFIKKPGISTTGYRDLEEYGIIGNTETVALVSLDGSIDWMCLPHLESSSVFANILDKEKGGKFTIQPKKSFKATQKYIDRTNIIETVFTVGKNRVTITDFMPPFKKRSNWHKQQILFRKVSCQKGSVDLLVNFFPRFNYARNKSKIKLTETGILAYTSKEKLFLDSSLIFNVDSDKKLASIEFTIEHGQEVWFVMQYNNRSSFDKKHCQKQFNYTKKYWDSWAHRCDDTCIFKGPWHDVVVRSGLTLKLLTHGETGAIAAAATTSLPEMVGGVRNWDYRFNWIRDSVFTVQAMYNLGHVKEAKELFNWYKKLYKGVRASDIQIMYGLHGEKDLPEKTLKHLSGYKNSKPVRIGNGAVKQKQLDIYGELIDVAYNTSKYGESVSKNDWQLLRKVVNHVCKIWNTKDAGIWEVRGGDKHFVYSKVMCWVALDRGIKIAKRKNFSAPINYWERVRDDIKETVIEKGFDEKRKTFVQSFGSSVLDASNLLIPIVGFLPADDKRVIGTINATLKYLTKDSFVYRYNGSDGISGHEGAFILCTFWLVDALALSGNYKKAEKIYTNLLKRISPLGLFAEEVDVKTKKQLGNLPQAFSHIGLINSAYYIGKAKINKNIK